MPKVPIDYSKTIMYKIVCNDLEIKDCYVGHTTNWIKRKASHKERCNNPKDKKHHLKVYQTIRENVGWDNWSMVQIEEYSCKDKREAEKRERELYEDLDANLNTLNPYRCKKEWYNINRDQLLEKMKQYREENKDKIKQKDKLYYETNKDQVLEKVKQYREENKDKIKQKDKLKYEKNKDKINHKKKIYYEANKETYLEKGKQYREENNDKINKIGCCDICGLEMLKRSISRHKERKHNL